MRSTLQRPEVMGHSIIWETAVLRGAEVVEVAARVGVHRSTMQRWVGPVSDRAVGRWRTVAPAGVVSTSGCGRGPGRAGGDASRATPPVALSGPVDPTLLVRRCCVPRVGQCGTSSWWGKRRCPPSDTVYLLHRRTGCSHANGYLRFGCSPTMAVDPVASLAQQVEGAGYSAQGDSALI